MLTGLTDPREDIVDAAVREVKEAETGLDSEFDRINHLINVTTSRWSFQLVRHRLAINEF